MYDSTFTLILLFIKMEHNDQPEGRAQDLIIVSSGLD